MSDKRRMKVPFYPYVLLLLSIVFVVTGAFYYLNFPSQHIVVYTILGIGLGLGIIAIICRPVMIKELFGTRKTALWLNDIVLVLIIIAIGVVLSHIAFRRNYRYDFTRNKIFSMSELTMKTIRELDKEVKIYGFFPKDSNEEGVMLDLFKEYKRLNDKLSWVMIDPQIDPVTSQQMKVSVMGTVIVECGANRQTVLPEDLFFIPNKIMSPNETPKFTGEQAITSAIANVLTGQKRVISFITGHGESSINGFKANDIAALNQLLTQENFEVVENSLITGDIDERASVVLVISPKSDFLESEISKLRNYIEIKKGNILFALDPTPNLKKLYEYIFKEYAVNVNFDIVVDVRGITRNYWSVAPVMARHDITNPLINKNLISLMFHCCSLTRDTNPDVKHTVLLSSIENSWAKRGLETKTEIRVEKENDTDVLGPLDLGVIAEKTNTASGSRALIIGDSDFLDNTNIPVSGNRDLIINAINWLAGNNKMLSIRPRIMEIPRIEFDKEDSNKIFSFCVLATPLFIVIFGFIVFMFRRRVR